MFFIINSTPELIIRIMSEMYHFYTAKRDSEKSILLISGPGTIVLRSSEWYGVHLFEFVEVLCERASEMTKKKMKKKKQKNKQMMIVVSGPQAIIVAICHASFGLLAKYIR
ncbi:unnamed protein product [Toxocara canis]|uniref:NAD_binding_6 domain-containing protein n=1 Tax=Toxocara canis TaxID=6265 RepID=A0A183UPI0_TOXCA|nr:unnamed protein product [Toxocara canis]